MAYEIYEFQTLAHLLRLVKPGDVVFDVGANVGYLTAYFAAAVGSSGQVHAFEPSLKCRPYLEHLKRSDKANVIHLNQQAVAESSRIGSFYETEHTLSHGYARLDRHPSAKFHEVSESSVTVISLDDYIAHRGIGCVALIKIDVEGHECSVLAGLRKTFAAGQRPILLLEATRGPEHDEELTRIEAFLTGYGYTSFLPQDRLIETRCMDLPERYHGNLLWSIKGAKSVATFYAYPPRY